MGPKDHIFNVSGAATELFSVDQEASQQLCAQAREAVANDDIAKAIMLLLQALCFWPSGMLAFHQLAELFKANGSRDEAALCRKGILPEHLLDQLPGKKAIADTALLALPAPAIARQVLYKERRSDLPEAGVLPLTTDQPAPPKPAFFAKTHIDSAACFVDQLPAGTLWHDSQHTLVFDQHANEVLEHAMADRALLVHLMQSHAPAHLKGRAFLIGARGAHNFYHWLADITPKLAVLKKSGFVFNANDRFIVPYANAEFCRQMVRQFGIEPDQLYETERLHTYLTADELIVPFLDNKMGLKMGPWLPQLMKEQFHVGGSGADLNQPLDSRRLFIMREAKSSDGRQIDNQDELTAYLQRYGFECLQPEKYSVAEQAQIFSEASVVVGAHGAALSNIMFSRTGTVVIEFYGAHLAPCFWAISALCDLRYFHHYCGNKDNAAHGTAVARSGNLTVPLSEVESLLVAAGII